MVYRYKAYDITKGEYFVKNFYCRYCGSTTAIKIGNLNRIRCMGCDRIYVVGDDWREIDKPNK